MLKYFYKRGNEDEVEIESWDYVEHLVEDGYVYDQSKSSSMRVVRENRQNARENGEDVWTIYHGGKLIIRDTKFKKES